MITTRDQAVAYLDSLIGSGIRPGLDRMKQLLEAAGNPERSVPAVLIAGTNGKGSTAATLSAIVHAAGYRTGLYTSPHLVDLEERWRIGELPVSSESLVAAVGRLEQCASAAGFLPTYFEALTLLAFFIFEESGCDLSVLEVGMGGVSTRRMLPSRFCRSSPGSITTIRSGWGIPSERSRERSWASRVAVCRSSYRDNRMKSKT